LGWESDTGELTIRLPWDKYVAWVEDISEALRKGNVSKHELESIVGRLNHSSSVVPLTRHFLQHLRQQIPHGRKPSTLVDLSHESVDELELWLKLLFQARNGISLNQMTIRKPSQLLFSDTCPFGLGEMTLQGRAWRLKIPKLSMLFGHHEAGNILEYLAMVITIWLCLLHCKEEALEQECILALGDNTSAIGWLFKMTGVHQDSFYDDSVRMISRKAARLMLGMAHCLYSQHIWRAQNTVADMLLFQGKDREEPHPLTEDCPSNKELTRRVLANYSQMVPRNFKISQLPDKISSFVELVMQTMELSFMGHRKNLAGNEKGPSVGGDFSARKWELTTISLMTYPSVSRSLSAGPSSKSFDGTTLTQQEALLADV
jgi:hypothetical protein